MSEVHPHVVALRRRAHRIRVWVASLAVALFLAVFATIYVQLADGRDPALGATTTTTTVVQTVVQDQSQTASVAPMTTQQS